MTGITIAAPGGRGDHRDLPRRTPAHIWLSLLVRKALLWAATVFAPLAFSGASRGRFTRVDHSKWGCSSSTRSKPLPATNAPSGKPRRAASRRAPETDPDPPSRHNLPSDCSRSKKTASRPVSRPSPTGSASWLSLTRPAGKAWTRSPISTRNATPPQPHSVLNNHRRRREPHLRTRPRRPKHPRRPPGPNQPRNKTAPHGSGAVSNSASLVELGGFEPPTFSLRTRRATNCAIAPDHRALRAL